MVTLTTGIVFLLFICVHFGYGEFTKAVRFAPNAYEVVRITESLRTTAVEQVMKKKYTVTMDKTRNIVYKEAL
jgi:hypothetical protein